MANRRTRQSESENTVTDTQTAEDTQDLTQETAEGTEPEAGTEAAGHTFNVGDEASVIRGKLRGRKGSILKYNAGNATYAVELEDGTLAVLNAGNLKAPVDSTVSVRALVGVLAASEDHEAATRLAAALDAIVPGVSVKLAEARAV